MTGTTARIVCAGAWLVAAAPTPVQQPRDVPRPVLAITASIIGTVVTSGTIVRPLERVIVTVSGAALPPGRSVITDDRGAFAIHGLPPGRVTIATTKPGFLPGAYGASRPGRPGTPVQLSGGDRLEITIPMTRGGVITGTIRDERGEPVPEQTVFVFDGRRPIDVAQAESMLTGRSGRGAVTTDDRGEFRIFDLLPGEYIIGAISPARTAVADTLRRSDAEVDAILARLRMRSPATATPASVPAIPGPSPPTSPPASSTMAPVFYPGTSILADAARVGLAAGEERAGLDFAMRAVPVSALEGTITSDLPVLPAYQINITPATWLPLIGTPAAIPRLETPTDPSRNFRFANLIPGRYTITITARANPAWTSTPSYGSRPGDDRGTLYAVEDVEVAGTDVYGVRLRLRPGGRFAGRVILDDSSTSPLDLTQLRVTVAPARSVGTLVMSGSTLIGNHFVGSSPVAVGADGTFEIAGLAPGRYRIECQIPSGGAGRWWLRSAMVRGRDLLDATLDVDVGTDVSGAVLTLTDRHTEIGGTLQSPAGLPAPEHFVIAFPVDRTLWSPASRRVRMTRPATDGSFAFADLPAGNYLLAALTDVEPDDWQKTEFLNELVPASVRVTLGEGEKTRQNLRIGR